MACKRILLRVPETSFISMRGALRPPRNVPYRGIYRTDGEVARKNELIVCQYKMNYHPGLNVYLQRDRGELLLKAAVDGKVMITQEQINPDMNIPEMAVYQNRLNEPIYKLTFNIVPLPISKTFTLTAEI